MKKKRGVVLLSVIFLFVALNVSCFKPKPEKVLDEFLNYYHRLNYKAAYEYLSEKDKAVKPWYDFLSDGTGKPDYGTLTEMSYEIVKIDIDGDKARATVEFTTPDIEELDKLKTRAFLNAASGRGEKNFNKVVKEKIESGEIPTKVYKDYYNLVKEKDGWRLFFDFLTEDKITEMHEEAYVLHFWGKYEKAKKIYKEILEIKPGDTKALEMISGINKKTAK